MALTYPEAIVRAEEHTLAAEREMLAGQTERALGLLRLSELYLDLAGRLMNKSMLERRVMPGPYRNR